MTFVAPPAANRGRGPNTVRLSEGDGVTVAQTIPVVKDRISDVSMILFIVSPLTQMISCSPRNKVDYGYSVDHDQDMRLTKTPRLSAILALLEQHQPSLAHFCCPQLRLRF